MDNSTKESKVIGKTLKFGDIDRLKYKYRAGRSTKTPRYRFVNCTKTKEMSEEGAVEDSNADSALICHSPMSSKSDSGDSEDSIEMNAPTVSEIKTTKADLDFDFGFDAERDAHLIAKNFAQQYPKDEVILFKRF